MIRIRKGRGEEEHERSEENKAYQAAETQGHPVLSSAREDCVQCSC